MVQTSGGQAVPVQIVGSSTFGRTPIINAQRTYNCFISDDWLVNFAGYKEAIRLQPFGTEGRALFTSTRGGFMIAVIGNVVFRINPNLGFSPLGNIQSSTGEVVIDENLSSQIIIVDGAGTEAYIYNYTTNDFGLVVWDSTTTAPFIPNYVTYQNTKFVFGNGLTNTNGSQWWIYISGFDPGTLADPLKLKNAGQTPSIQTKPDFAKAAIRIPSKGNFLLVLGSVVGEIWADIGGAEIYQRQATLNIDYGVASVSTIAATDDMVVWLGINEKSAPAIMVMGGDKAKRISTDGIDELLSHVNFPSQSTAMFYRQDGHVFYILTFFNPDDNFSIMYDFTSNKFFDLTDWDLSYYPARQLAYFGTQLYFISSKQGSVMEINTDITYDSTDIDHVYEIPRIRTCDTFRLPGSEKFIVNRFSFTVENGVEPNVYFQFVCEGHILGETSGLIMYSENDEPLLLEGGQCQVYRPRIDVTLSKNGGETWSSRLSYFMHATGDWNNQPRFNQLGSANQFTIQLRFWGFGRVNCQNGLLEVRQ